MPVRASIPLVIGRGLMGHAAAVHSESSTTMTTSTLPAMGKEVNSVVLQVPPIGRDLRYLLGSDTCIPRFAGDDGLGPKQSPPACNGSRYLVG